MIDKKNKFELLLRQIKNIVENPVGAEEKLTKICKLLKDSVPYYNWVGFYVADNEKRELNLGPYIGEPTEHTRIPFGRGICGQAAERRETFVVQDVSKETNYLACSLKVKSEIVVPVFKDDKVVAEIDIDSHELAPFTEEDKEFLEKLAVIIKDCFA
ncbi:MAG: GAF domain-containing protein [candidate division WOR-3 bacterium]|nr:GAF domain-containing protein [candidate division WOR-3 bacterium]